MVNEVPDAESDKVLEWMLSNQRKMAIFFISVWVLFIHGVFFFLCIEPNFISSSPSVFMIAVVSLTYVNLLLFVISFIRTQRVKIVSTTSPIPEDFNLIPKDNKD